MVKKKLRKDFEIFSTRILASPRENDGREVSAAHALPIPFSEIEPFPLRHAGMGETHATQQVIDRIKHNMGQWDILRRAGYETWRQCERHLLLPSTSMCSCSHLCVQLSSKLR
ncbi:hypothetical protein ADUPG1_007145 [Aduncisulcus paluster]|uniref:Uncharacterized protein n=1 Tax=Aduncisulcus paluster TaxID=2918883 RepID=A0ABQ5KNV5_9EUKA|nr:hypothetical protein ADUPG1_007145 [Aduncisulcus paluster]